MLLEQEYIDKTSNYLFALENAFDRAVDGDKESGKEILSLITEIVAQDMDNIVNVSISGKAHNLLKRITVSTQEDHSTFRKFVRLIISLDNKNVYDALETHFISEKDLTAFSIVLEEFKKKGKDLSSMIDTFVSLIDKKAEKLESIEKILEILEKDKLFVLNKLIESRNFNGLNYFIAINLNDNKNKELGPEFAKTIKENKIIFERFPNNTYLLSVAHLIALNENSTSTLIDKKQDCIDMNAFIIDNALQFIHINALLKNYCAFLDEDSFEEFEKEFIKENENAYSLLSYAKSVERSSKRLVLNKLLFVTRKNSLSETYLVDFLKHFPQYKNLLLML